jgi:hypothetical protein
VAYKGDILLRLDGQVEVGQDWLIVGVTEINVIELDMPFERRYILLAGLDHVRVGVDQSENPLRRR